MSPVNRNEFQRLLFRTAFCLMACDGHIDDREVEEIRLMEKSASYFKDIDLSEELEKLLVEIKTHDKLIVDQLFKSLKELDLSIVQEMVILEVAFRLINADKRVDENEVKFVQYLRSKLKIHDQLIKDRFGLIDYFESSSYRTDITDEILRRNTILHFEIPEFEILNSIDFNYSNFDSTNDEKQSN
jgi:hypothetical protein